MKEKQLNVALNPSHRDQVAQKGWKWDTVAYQVYPRSFKDSNNDGIGDIKGITQKLNYLKDLGIRAIWISPFYPSPMADFGYDISNYCDIEPMFGTIEDFKVLMREAHSKNIKIILDFVPNHTSQQHPWFIESKSSKNNPKRDWYTWKDPKSDGSAPNNWLSVFGGSAWEYDEFSRQYYLHSFVKEQPDLNWDNPEVREAMKLVVRFWMELGVDGLRLDAIRHLSKHENFEDDPINPDYKGEGDPYFSLTHKNSKDQSQLFSHLSEIVDTAKEYGDKFVVTEAYPNWRDDVEEYKRFYDNLGNEYAAPFNFSLIGIKWEAPVVKKFIDKFQKEIKEGDLPVYVLGNHDRPRIASSLGQNEARVAAVLLLTLPGMPYIYQGEEIGMKNGSIPEEKVQDPWGKNVPGFGRDPSRTPMQWDSSVNAGFSSAEPWLPVSEDYKTLNVEEEKRNPQSFFNLYKKLIEIRNNTPAFKWGQYIQKDLENENIFAFVRKEAEEFMVLLNFTDKRQETELREKGQIILSTHMDSNSDIVSLRPNEGLVVKLNQKENRRDRHSAH